MSVHHLIAAHVLAEPVGAYTLTSGRLWSVVGGGLALAGVAVGALAVARSARSARSTRGAGRRGAVVALAAGLGGMAVGALIVAAAEGGPGAGYGIVGGYVDLGIGLIATALGGLGLARSRRTA